MKENLTHVMMPLNLISDKPEHKRKAYVKAYSLQMHSLEPICIHSRWARGLIHVTNESNNV